MGAAAKIIRWSINSASVNFDIDRATLRKRLEAEGISAGADGLYSTADICLAKYGDLKGDLIRAQTRNQNESADLTAVKKSNLLRENIPVELVEKVWGSALINLKQKISYAPISDKVKQELSRDLMNIPVDEYFKDAKPTGEEE